MEHEWGGSEDMEQEWGGLRYGVGIRMKLNGKG